MKIQVLDNLQRELDRLFIAGSKFAQNDPRIAKLIPILEKMGERAPVMKKLAQQAELLIQCKAEESAVLLAETSGLLYSVLNTQVVSDTEYETQIESCYTDEYPETPLPYSAISVIKEALTASKGGRYSVIENAYKNKLFFDARLFPLLSYALDDKYTEIPIMIREKIIPNIGDRMIPYLLSDLKITGKKSDALRFSLLDELGYEQIDELTESVLNGESSTEVLTEAIKSLGKDVSNEQKLLDILSSKKQDIREAALYALVRLDSEQGKEKMMAILQSKRYKPALKAISVCTDQHAIDQLAGLLMNTIKETQKCDDKNELTFKRSYLFDFIYSLSSLEPEPFFEAYTEVIKNPNIVDGYVHIQTICHQFITHPSNHVFSYLKDLLNAKSIIKNLPDRKSTSKNYAYGRKSDLADLIQAYYEVAHHHCDEKEIYDTFSGYYNNKQLLMHTNISDSTKLDDQWADLFIKSSDYQVMALLIKYETVLSNNKYENIWHYLFNRLKLVSKTKNLDLKLCIVLPEMILKAPPEKCDKLAEYTIEYIVLTGTGSKTYIGEVFDAVNQRLDIFNKPEYAEALKTLLGHEKVQNRNRGRIKELCEMIGGR